MTHNEKVKISLTAIFIFTKAFSFISNSIILLFLACRIDYYTQSLRT